MVFFKWYNEGMTKIEMLLKQMNKELIFSVAKIELPTLTFLSTEKVIENLSSDGLMPQEIDVILSLKKAFEFLLLEKEELSSSYIKSLNYEIARGTTFNAGKIRIAEVYISGSSYVPKSESDDSFNEFINHIKSIKDSRERAIEYLIEATKRQFFYDGNKRTSLVVANKILLDANEGLIAINERVRDQYLTLLKDFYEDESKKENLKIFLQLCIFDSTESYLTNLRKLKVVK